MLFALIQNGDVINVIIWDGIEDFGKPDDVEAIELPEGSRVSTGWTYDGTDFIPPPPPPVVPPTPEQILDANRNWQAQLIYQASFAMAPVLMSLQLGDATDDETVLAKSWQKYYRDLQAVDITMENPAWPVPPNAT